MVASSGPSTPRPEGIGSITAPIEAHLQALERYLLDEVSSFEPEVQELVRYTFQHSGKKIRPILVFYSGWTGEGEEPPTDLIRAAAIVELVHLATLVHDDILDNADLRHRTPTVAHRYGAHAAVLLGDAVFAHALKLAADFPTTFVCREVAQATRQVCSGEIAQTFARGRADLSLPAYYRMIDLKTAELFRVSALLGATLTHPASGFPEAAAEFARRLGIAYQIFDDLADLFSSEDKAGKTLGTDLASGKFTLPFLLWFPTLTDAQQQEWIRRINTHPDAVLELRAEWEQAGILPKVVDAFRHELRLATEALEPYQELPAAQRLPRLLGFVEAACAKLLAQIGYQE
ncbi:MAG: polyprenyl synthetase family protein [Verrucomicrobiota bacterium JB022]|nr:polyprenyl synthetase family protein [Verrucomicrobiota bacterium JB022]